MKAILFSSLVLLGCATDRTDDVLPDEPTGTIFALDSEEQGRHLLGNIADAFASGDSHFSVLRGTKMLVGAAKVTVDFSVDSGSLVATDANGGPVYTDPSAFKDVVFVNGANGARQLRIKSVLLRSVLQGVVPAWYELEYSRNNGTTWSAYCDSTISSYALPMQGRWSTTRRHLDSTDLTFGCVDSGVTAKCVLWGYVPGPDSTKDSWKIHQACTQMANADYCKNGIPHTRELTPIVIRDYMAGAMPTPEELPTLTVLDPMVTWPPPDEFFFEAAWQADGPALCLSKLRWASLPIGGYCPSEVPDPRSSEDSPGTNAKFCDDVSFAKLRGEGALLFDASKPMDLFLHRWKNGGGDLVSTVDGYVTSVPLSPPFLGYGYRTPDENSILLRTLPGSLELTDVIEVFQQHNRMTGDRVLAPLSSTGKGVTDLHVVGLREGYLLKAQGPDLVKFNLYRDGTDYVTATENPGGSFGKEAFLGYVIAPPVVLP